MQYCKLVEYTLNSALTPQEQFGSAALGLAGEVGEVIDLLKKHLYHGHELDRNKLLLELGDVRYYLEWLLLRTGSNMAEIEQLNTEKLLARYPNGFTSQQSIDRR